MSLFKIFLFLDENKRCGYSLEAPRRGASNEYPWLGASNEYPQRMFSSCEYSLEAPRRGASNEYPQRMFSSRNKKNIYMKAPLIKTYGGRKGMTNSLRMILRSSLIACPAKLTHVSHKSSPTLAAWLEGRITSFVIYLNCCLPDELGDLTQKTCARRHATPTNTNVP